MKSGDKVVCVDAINVPIRYGRDDWGQDDLVVNKIYTVSRIEWNNDDDGVDYTQIYIKELKDVAIANWYFKYRFISLKESRRNKLEVISGKGR